MLLKHTTFSIKFLILMLCFCSCGLLAKAQAKELKQTQADTTKEVHIVEAGCGQCKLGLPGKDCDLAIRLNGKSYFVDGTNIDQHGNAHAKDGFCNAIRKAKVQGEIKGDRFKATYFQLLPAVSEKKKGG
ncbi:MAG: glutaminyl-tRNA synthetase [Segetibacter sp.]|nr:glutaminyl-tRNA synthetase [Segetibacter sp.]